jgi:hypothetical protein
VASRTLAKAKPRRRRWSRFMGKKGVWGTSESNEERRKINASRAR